MSDVIESLVRSLPRREYSAAFPLVSDFDPLAMQLQLVSPPIAFGNLLDGQALRRLNEAFDPNES